MNPHTSLKYTCTLEMYKYFTISLRKVQIGRYMYKYKHSKENFHSQTQNNPFTEAQLRRRSLIKHKYFKSKSRRVPSTSKSKLHYNLQYKLHHAIQPKLRWIWDSNSHTWFRWNINFTFFLQHTELNYCIQYCCIHGNTSSYTKPV